MKKSSLQSAGRGDRRRSPISFLTQEETKRLFSTIKNKRDRAIFLTAYRHGLRASEIGMLQRTDVLPTQVVKRMLCNALNPPSEPA
jgi:integrase